MPDAVCVLIASPLEPELVARIGAVDPRVSVLYAPDLMPEPRYPADHTGTPRPLSPADVDRWPRLRAQADISFDNLRRWLSGRPLRNVYDRAAGY
jgi:glyoxylate/hydroxypyruvate reductase